MAQYNLEDTIAAIATPIGEGGLSVIRVSGEKAFEIADRFFKPKSEKKSSVAEYDSHTVHYGSVSNEKGEVLDQVLLTCFVSPNSYTGEDVVEISCHGGLVVTRKILDLITAQGVRHAEAGEFTKRAFLNGKMDLTQAEAVHDLIKAKSDKSLEVALKQLAGGLSKQFASLKEAMMHLLAHLEAYIDFPNEQIEAYTNEVLHAKFRELQERIQGLIASFTRGAMIREGVSVVIAGKPNVGKSSLFNALLARDRALVSEYPGTTRDHLEESVEIEGVLMRLIDTAGLMEAEHPVDQMGVTRTLQTFKEAQAFIYIVDGSQPLDELDRDAFKELGSEKPIIVVVNKSDLERRLDVQTLESFTGTAKAVEISTKTSTGLDTLERYVVETVFQGGLESSGEGITRLRHKNALEKSLEALNRSQEAFREKRSFEFVTFDLKVAIDELRELIGEIYSEDLLDVIFAEFCIGK